MGVDFSDLFWGGMIALAVAGCGDYRRNDSVPSALPAMMGDLNRVDHRIDSLEARISRLADDSAKCAQSSWQVIRLRELILKHGFRDQRDVDFWNATDTTGTVMAIGVYDKPDTCRWFYSECTEKRRVECTHGGHEAPGLMWDASPTCVISVVVRDSIWHCENKEE